MDPVVSMQYLDSLEIVYTSAMIIPSGMNQFALDALYIAHSGTSVTSGIDITPQYSFDGQTWTTPIATLSTGSNEPPYRELFDFPGPTSPPMGAYKYVRLMIENKDSVRALISVWISFYPVNT